MSLSSLQLDAFLAVARAGSFSEAAKILHVTQSALSQRIQKLEDELETSLFLREPTGIRLTETGERLLRFATSKELLEEEFLSSFKAPHSKELSGLIKIAGFSTFVRSRLLPKLGNFSRTHPGLSFEVLTREVRELPRLLSSGAADFIFTTDLIQKESIVCRPIGQEENVLIKPKSNLLRPSTFIDHDEFDTTTFDFWRKQKTSPPQIKRLYFDEIYTIISAVEEGLGQAVVPRHLIEKNKNVTIAQGLNPLIVPIYLCYFRQNYLTRLQKEVLELFPEIQKF